MKLFALTSACALGLLASAHAAQAQTWTGPYVAGSLGAGFHPKDASETIRFDTNLDRISRTPSAPPPVQTAERFEFQNTRAGLSYRF
jgi:opacity protein-like surface antigen